MPEDPTVFLLRSYLYLPAQNADSLLGRLVKNYHSPNDNYAPSDPTDYHIHDIIPMEYQTFSLGASTQRRNWATILADQIGNIRWLGEGDSRFNLDGKRIWSRRLQQHEDVFKLVAEDGEVLSKVPAWIGPLTSHVCMIVGVYLCEDVAVAEHHRKKVELVGRGQVPLGQVLTGSPMPTTVGNVGGQGGHQTEEQQTFRANGRGQYVFGLELKLVKRKNWRHADELQVLDKSPKIIRGRRLGSEEIIEEENRSEEGPSEDNLDARLVDLDDLLAKEISDACTQDLDLANAQ